MATTRKNKAGDPAASKAPKTTTNPTAEGAAPSSRQGTEKTRPGGGFSENANTRLGGVKEHMPVFASCGTKVGVVDRVEGDSIKLTKNDSPDGQHHFIPADWVERVDEHVHLSKNSMETEQNWKPDAASCGCTG
jgi:hypothetical protein